MNQEDKDLLLKDLCARLPYGVIVTTTNPAVEFGIISGISIKNKITIGTKHADIVFDCTEVKPYLRPISSMTEEEQKEFVQFHCVNICPVIMDCYLTLDNESKMFDWLNKNKFDYRGLIPMSLAIAVTEENNPYANN